MDRSPRAGVLGAKTAGSLLGQVAMALTSTLELREVLRRLAEIGHEVTGSGRCSLFLLEGRLLHPAVAISAEPDEPTWSAFRAMKPIRLEPRQWEVLRRGTPIALEDARSSELIPAAWRRRFAPGAVLLVPLLADGEPCGLMAVDWPEPRTFGLDELSVLESIASCAGLAVRNARLFETAQRRSRLQEALTRGAAALAALVDPSEIAERLVDAYLHLIGARFCAIGTFDAERASITTIASSGARPAACAVPLASIPLHVVERVSRAWERSKAAVELEAEPFLEGLIGAGGAGWYLLQPLVVEGQIWGAVLLGFDAGRRVDDEERAAVTALARLAAAALERATLLERQDRRLRQLGTLARVSAALTEGASAAVMIREINQLLADHGVEVVGIALGDEKLAQLLGAELLRDEREDRAAGAASEGAGSEDAGSEDAGSVPMMVGRQLVGRLVFRPAQLDPEERSFLETLARDLAELAHRNATRLALEEASRAHAVADERERLARDLHDTAGQALVAIALLARRRLEEIGDGHASAALVRRFADIADQGRWEVDQALRALAFMPTAQRGLVPALRALGEAFAGDSGIAVSVEVKGRPCRLPSDAESACYRVVHEALTNAWRHAGCTAVSVQVRFSKAAVVLRVADDGVGLPPDIGEATGVGLDGMYGAMKEVGGSLHVGNDASGGAVVEAHLPRQRR